MKKKILRKVAAAVFCLAVSFISTIIVLGVSGVLNPPQEWNAELISRQRKLPENSAPKLVLRVADPIGTDGATPRYLVPLDKAVQEFAEASCEETGVPVGLLYAMMYAESRFIVDATNGAGDMGLLQINSRYAAAYGATDLLDPYQNIKVGTGIISGYLEQYPDDLEKALMAYNCGPSRAAELWAEGVTSTGYTETVRAALAELTKNGRLEL